MRIPARDEAAGDVGKDGSGRPRRALPQEVRSAAGPAPAAPGSPAALQRAVGNAAVTRMLAPDRGDGAVVQRAAAGGASVQRAGVRQVLRAGGRPLEGGLREEMESRLGADFSDVRVHTGPTAQRSAAEIGARAYTSGSDVVIGAGGGDKHTLAHELTHVIQQRQGPVSGTDNGDGLRVSDPGDRFERAAEANARRVMSGPAPVQRDACDQQAHAHAHPHAHADAAVVQRKGPEELGTSLQADPPRGGSLLGRFKSALKQPEPPSGLVTRMRAAIDAYDRDPNRDPMHCLMALTNIQMEFAPELDDAPAAVRTWLETALQTVRTELNLVNEQLTRDDALPDEARAPFTAMTDKGMLWQQQQWADSAAAFHMHGASYFRELSELNRAGMGKEIDRGRGDRNWVGDVRNKLTTALRQSMLCHYTGRSRAETMLGQGQMKSKTELLKANPNAENNSEAYDKHVLANEGFVFFFLEVPGSPFRETRFGGDEPVRIEIPLTSSPLMSQGWLMLSDFAQREYPTVRAKPEDPAQTESKLGTRENTFSGGFTLPVRKFDVGAGKGDPLDTDKAMEMMAAETDQERKALVMTAMIQAMSDQHSSMTYGSGQREQVHSERLRSNTLMGQDIVPGLAERAIVEIERIGAVNPQLADRLKAMSGDELMRYLLKDLLRPQAMLPNTVDLSAARVVTETGQQVTAPTS